MVSWQLPTVLETMVVMAALTRLGAIQNPIVPALREREVGLSPRNAPPEVLDHTVGPPVAGVSVRVVDANGHDVAPGDDGELWLKGPQCFLGYVDAELDDDAFEGDGWFRSGDSGLIDADGNVRITGRVKDTIVRNAENVSALEVENTLITHPAVADIAVIGVPDARTGERVCAVVVPTPQAEVTLASLVEHCRADGLTRYKHPERVEIVDALPRNLTGKVLKKGRRAMFR